MADKKISELSAVTDVVATDEYPLRRAGATNKITAANLVPIFKISSLVLGAPAANFDFTSIPSTYSRLQLVWLGATDDSAAVVARILFNNDTGANYDYQTVGSSSATASGSETIGAAFGRIGAIPASSATSHAGTGIVDIPWYAATTFHKMALCQSGYSTGVSTGNLKIDYFWTKWRSTTAINRITLTLSAGNWITGSSCVLYGVL